MPQAPLSGLGKKGSMGQYKTHADMEPKIINQVKVDIGDQLSCIPAQTYQTMDR